MLIEKTLWIGYGISFIVMSTLILVSLEIDLSAYSSIYMVLGTGLVIFGIIRRIKYNGKNKSNTDKPQTY